MLMWAYARRRRVLFFFFNDTATTEIYTLSLHDALPICLGFVGRVGVLEGGAEEVVQVADIGRSEEHTSELQSPCNLVCRLLLEKKKKLVSNPGPTTPRPPLARHAFLTHAAPTCMRPVTV